jgi:glutathione synthase/RimK-type ligase-like ATP-grasp enzyme
MIGIHNSGNWSFAPDWISYCDNNNIPYKIVDCYADDIIDQVRDCQIVMWHHHHTSSKDKIYAMQLLFALEHGGKVVFPDFKTAWYFDDKLGQKYLLEIINASMVKTYAFYDQVSAVQWAKTTQFPIVAKLRGGAGSNNVKLLKTVDQANSYIKKSFKSGFPSYDKLNDLKENIRRKFIGNGKWMDIAKSIRRVLVGTEYSRTFPLQRGYVLFQDFMPNNSCDIRVVVIGYRAFAIKRLVRENDFRASGSGYIEYDPKDIDIRCIKISFDTSNRLQAQCLAYDFVFNSNNDPLIVEINYGYAHRAYDDCPGYWDIHLAWHEGKFNSTHWMIEEVIKEKQKNEH